MAEISTKYYLDKDGLAKVFKLINDNPPSSVLLGSIKTVTVNNNINSFAVDSIPSNTQQHTIFVNGGSQEYTVTIPTTYKTPDGNDIVLTVPVGGFAEANFMKIGSIIYARGL